MIVDAIKSAVLTVQSTVATQAFASTDIVMREMSDLANEVATDIARSHDWQRLTKIATITGGGADSFALPDDYDRMAFGASVADPATAFWGYEPFASVSDWMAYRNGGVGLDSPGGWILMGGRIHFWPAPTGQAVYPYISNHWAEANDGTPKGAFTADNDRFLLDERLIKLALVWRWKANKGLQYAEDMATSENALAQAQGRDRGAYTLGSGRGGTVGKRPYVNRLG